MLYTITDKHGQRFSFVVPHIEAFYAHANTLLLWVGGEQFIVPLDDEAQANAEYSSLLTLVSRYWGRR